jgi:hypothetical protein
MRALSVPELLGVWESGLAQGPVERALTLLAAACPDTPRDDLANWTIGRRDSSLLTLREWTFGPRLASVAVCPECGQRVELGFDVPAVRVDKDLEPPTEVAMLLPGYELQLRPPNSADVAAIAAEPKVERQRRLLFERCLVAIRRDGQPGTPGELPAEAIDAAAARLAEADPQADVQLNVSCPSCGKAWQALFDIVSFFWSEIEAWALQILREVHILASSYGWGEADILALSPIRRQFYLEMAAA